MAINIQNLIDAINTKVQALDSSSDITEINKLTRLTNNINSSGGVLEYRSLGQLPDADSGNIGKLVYTQDKKYDDHGTFYFGVADGWQKITLTADSDEANTVFESWTFQGSTGALTLGGQYAATFRLTFADDTLSSALSTSYAAPIYSPNYSAGSSSNTHGYSGGNSGNGKDKVLKVQFASVSTAAEVGNLVYGVGYCTGTSSETHGYTVGGTGAPGAVHDGIQKHSFATDGNSVNIGYLGAYMTQYGATGSSSAENGYALAGNNSSTYTEKFIKKYPHASDGGAVTSGNLAAGRFHMSGLSGSEYGYAAGGGTSPPFTVYNTIERFPFAADADAASVGSLTAARRSGAAVSSQQYGYMIGGGNTSGNMTTVDKHIFASSANSTSVGTLSNANQSQTPTQY